MLWLAGPWRHRKTDCVLSDTLIQSCPLWEKTHQTNQSNKKITHSLHLFFFLSRPKDHLYLFFSPCSDFPCLLLIDRLNDRHQFLQNKKHHKRKGDKLIRDAEAWRHPTTTNQGLQTRRLIEGQHQWNRGREDTFFFNNPQAISHHCSPHRSN